MSYSRTRTTRRTSALLLSTILASGLAAPAFAQATSAPAHRNLDSNGVDLTLGDFVMAFPEGSIGSGEAELSLVRTSAGGMASQWDNYGFRLVRSGQSMIVTISRPDRRSDTFTMSVVADSVTNPNGSSLTKDLDIGAFVYRTSDGTSVPFFNPNYDVVPADPYYCSYSSPQTGCTMIYDTVTSPDGGEIYLGFDSPPNGNRRKLLSVANSFGYSINFTYSGYNRTKADFKRGVIIEGSVSYSYPSAGVVNVTDMAGNVWGITNTAVKRPGEASPSFSVSGAANMTSVTRDGVTTTYARTVNGSTGTMVVTNALNEATTVVSNLTLVRPTSVTNGLGEVTSYAYDTFGRPTRVTQPEGNYVNYTYDARGNVTETRQVAKAGSELADIVTSATFTASCTNPLTCNKPVTTTDAKGNVTNYSYDATHGGVTAVTAPAPTTGAIRPETRIGYGLVGNSYQPVTVSSCQTLASCAGLADEVKTSITHDVNGNVSSITKAAGNNSLTTSTTMTYDPKGDLLTVDGPLSSAADTVRFRYDAARRNTGVIGPDPDGTETRKHLAARTSYNIAGRITASDTGTVDSQSDTDWAAFDAAETVTSTYDANSRKVKDVLSSGGTAYAVQQYSYDGLGRIECSATRMNPAIFSSLPASVCTPGTAGTGINDFGPDRIVRNTYDAAGQATKVQTAFGTAAQADEVTTSFTSNGQAAYVIDAENNRTGFTYDGHDRMLKTEYPSATKGANAVNPSDYEQLTYDANGSITSRRLRDGQSIGYGYDNLDRLTAKNLPGAEPDATYSYDLLGRALTAAQGGQTLGFTHDALSRNLTQSGPLGTVSYAYDAAGRRISTVYPAGGTALTVNYDYDMTGNVTAIKENGSAALAAYAYDNLGRRSSVTYGNGVVQSFGFDPVSRLATLTSNLGGTAQDQTATFTYNPASQIDTLSKSNDVYAWGSHYNIDRVYGANGLNQLKASTPGSGQVSVPVLGYDVRGNTTGIGASAYTYDSENMLKTGPGGVTLAYDPLGRLYQTVGTATTRFGYDGQDLIAEYNVSNALLRRYVHGAGVDEPILHYEGTGLATKRYLTADERGSITAVTNASGTSIVTNKYDEYGNPASTNSGLTTGGRFGYTGQVWLPDPSTGSGGMWYYKARIYNPALGRFMQTDPIGYADGMNLYNYVGSDPVNKSDPAGKAKICVAPTGSRIRSQCVDTGNDNLLTLAQINDIASDFRGFILANGTSGRPRDISAFFKPIVGNISNHDREMLEAVSRFVGFSLQGEALRRWLADGPIHAGERDYFSSKQPAYYRKFADNTGYVTISGSLNSWFGGGYLYDSPSNLARALIHENGHGVFSAYDNPDSLYLHHKIDRIARSVLRSSGLAGGSCSSLGYGPSAFPGC